MTCRKCNAALPDGAAFCHQCGTKQQITYARHRRGNGQGNAYKRGDTWTARVVVGWKPGDPPKPIWRTKGGFPTKKAALEHCAMLRNIQGKGPQKLIYYWDMYAADDLPKLGASKQTAYRIAWKKLLPLHLRPVDQITVAELRQAVEAVATTYYPAKDCKTILTHLFTLAGADGAASRDLPSYINLPKLQEKERETFSPQEQEALWRAYEAGVIDAAIPLIMIYTGMMPGEMMALKVDHINLGDQTIQGVGKKTEVRKASPIVLPDDILPVVADCIGRAQKSGYLWPHSEAIWYRRYYAVLADAGCRRLEPYCCRHSTATRLTLTEGIAPQTVKRIMRWSTTKMLDRYAHPSVDDIRQASNTMRRTGTN